MAQYVYIFFEPAVDPKQNKVFYVGKGTGNRPKGHLSESGVSSAMRVSNASDVPPNEKGARTENLLDSELQKEQSPGGAPNLDKVQRIQRLVHERRLGPKDMIRVIAQGLDDSMAETLEAFAIHFVFGKSNLTNRAPGKHHERFRSYGDWSPQFGQSVNKDKPFYVYVLRNPKTNDVLYVGKGTGDRKFAHFKEGEALNEDEKTRKHLALQTLQDQGYVPENIAFVIASNLTAEEAFAIESFALKYVYGHTMAANTNIVRGHKSFHFRAKDDWDLRLGFDLPFLAASSKQKAREMERDLMLGEAMDVPLLAVIGSFRQLEWGEPRIVDAGELAYEAPVQVADGTQGGRIKVFIRGKGGIQVEFRAGTKAKKWLLDFFSRLNYTNRRDDVQLVYFPDVWVDKPTPDLKEATERVRIVLSLLNSNSKEDLVQKVGDGGVAVLLSVDPIVRAKIEKRRRKIAETRKKNKASRGGGAETEPEDDAGGDGDGLPPRGDATDAAPTIPQPSPAQFLSRNRKEMGEVSLYYPGSGSDWGPLKMFAENCDLCEAVHVDYLIGRQEAEKPIYQFRLPPIVSAVLPQDLMVVSWDDFWPKDEESRRFGKPTENTYGLRSTINCGQGKHVRFLFLSTEAIQTFEVIYRAKAAPTVIVLQDHGYGGNWTTFARGGELELRARSLGKLPKYLFVAKNTKPWDGYEQVTEYAEYEGQMHSHARALYRLNQQ